MNILKRSFAIVLTLALLLSCLVGCHQKGEVAVKIGDIEFTSGYYACALVFADREARALVEEDLSEKEDTPDEIKYWKYKVEDTEYTKWVENKTLETLKKIAALKDLCNKADVKLDEETQSAADANTDYLWENYSYSELMEKNGVSKDTFKQYMRDNYLADAYFEHIYGKDGEKEVPAEDLSKQLSENYVLVNSISVDFDNLDDDEKAEKKALLTAYETALRDGTKTFEEIYLEYNNISADEHEHEEAEEGELVPADYHATVLGSEDTDYASDQFETAKAMAVGEVKLVTLKDDAGLVLLVKKDISADAYYISQYDTVLRKDIAGDEYEEDIEKYGKDMTCDVNKKSTKQFKIKDIYYPENA